MDRLYLSPSFSANNYLNLYVHFLDSYSEYVGETNKMNAYKLFLLIDIEEKFHQLKFIQKKNLIFNLTKMY